MSEFILSCSNVRSVLAAKDKLTVELRNECQQVVENLGPAWHVGTFDDLQQVTNQASC